MTLFVVAAAMLAATALAAALALRLGWTETLLAAYLLAAAELVLLGMALSPFHAVSRAGYLGGELALLAPAVGFWLRRGRPLPPRPDISRRSLGRHPVLVVLALAVGAGLAFQALLVAIAPPNNWDSMTYHLSRAAAWYQRGAVEWHPAPSARENVFPPNAEIEILWTLVLLGRDTLAELPQLVAELATMTAIFGIGRRLGFGRAASLFPALLLATLSQVALQATTTQNDLVVTAAITAAAYFVLGRTRIELALAGIAVGLALGTKLTAVFALPVLALLALAVLPRRRLAELAAACACGFAALGGWGYAANVIHDGSPLGDAEEISAFAPERTVPGTVSTVARVLWRFVDLSGYEADIRVLVTLQNAGILAFDSLRIEWSPPESTSTPFFVIPSTRVHEDVSFFGPLGALLLVPLSLAFALGGALRRVPRDRLVLALALPLFVLELALAYRYNDWLGRFLILPVALTLPLAAWLYRWRLVAGGAAACGVLFLGLALARNEAKPTPLSFGSSPPVWALDRTDAQALVRPEMAGALRLVERDIPATASVGYRLGADAWIYPLYGPRLTRRLVQLPGRDVLAAAERRGLRYVVADGAVRVRPGWRATHDRESRWTVLVRA